MKLLLLFVLVASLTSCQTGTPNAIDTLIEQACAQQIKETMNQ